MRKQDGAGNEFAWMGLLPDLIVRSHQICTMCGDDGFGLVDGVLAVKDGRVLTVQSGEVPESWRKLIQQVSRVDSDAAPAPVGGNSDDSGGPFSSHALYIDARDRVVLPGFVDAHTHLVHAGSRENELAMKLAGVPYLEILKQGGGIQRTVRATRAATHEELAAKAGRTLDAMLACGVTTIEAKSGYGLDFDTELRCLRIARELDATHPIDIVSTYLGAHAVPPEFKGNTRGYMDFMIETVMPAVKAEGLAECVDVFCEEGVFSPEETRELLDAARALGFRLKLHADEIVPLGGAELAAEAGALSADHLLAASDEGIAALARTGTTAVLLPGTSFYLMTGRFARARTMLDAGVRVAVATDYNPGSCPCANIQAILPFACMGMRMTPEEVFRGMTINAAHAIGREDRIGSLEPGKQADFTLFDAPNPEYLAYRFGENSAAEVWKRGERVWARG